ncbi:MAG: c-type cytochrome [Pirellulales bacterium]|nr:c-type cytochrome [Pirellulales bacterium]
MVAERPALVLLLLLLSASNWATADELAAATVSSTSSEAAARGYRYLTTKPYQPVDFTAAEFDALWKVWPPELKVAAEKATPAERRRLAFSRYGLVPNPDSPDGAPLGVVDTPMGWAMNCLSCHGGKVAGRVIPGLANSHYAFQTLIQDVANAELASGQPLSPRQANTALIPLGRSNGTTNAQTASVLLSSLRDRELHLLETPRKVPFENYDLDAPPFWNTKKKSHLYIDGFVPKTARVIMQFVLVPANSAETIKSWESDFQDVLAWIESVEAPKYPYAIDRDLAERGRPIFNRACAECHGTYGPSGSYPEKRVDIAEIGTDRLRLDGMPVEHRRFYQESWFGEFGKLEVVEQPTGYVAPPLDGVWASAPYFHNGSVPTLWHVLHEAKRPTVWLRSEDGYDHERVGLEVTEFDKLPPEVRRADDKRRYFNTRLRGKSAAGHSFPEQLNEGEKRAVLEYLKSL